MGNRKTTFYKVFKMSIIKSTLILSLLIVFTCAGFYMLGALLGEDVADARDKPDSEVDQNDEEQPDEEDEDEDEEIEEEEEYSPYNANAVEGEYDGYDYSEFDAMEDGQFAYVVQNNLTLESPDSTANVTIINPPQNELYMSLDIELDGENIYSSKIVKNNHYVEDDYLSVELEKGEYQAVGIVHAYDMETEIQLDTEYTVDITITVE